MRRTLLPLALALVLATAACGDTPAGWTSSGGSHPVCDTRTMAPRLAVELAVPAIIAESTSWCDEAPATHVVTLWIEQLTGTEWLMFNATRGDSTAECREVPAPGFSPDCQVVIYRCESGTYRTRALVAGSSPTGTPFSFTLPETPSAVITCPNPAARG